jgi:hypothetical protein
MTLRVRLETDAHVKAARESCISQLAASKSTRGRKESSEEEEREKGVHYLELLDHDSSRARNTPRQKDLV